MSNFFSQRNTYTTSTKGNLKNQAFTPDSSGCRLVTYISDEDVEIEDEQEARLPKINSDNGDHDGTAIEVTQPGDVGSELSAAVLARCAYSSNLMLDKHSNYASSIEFLTPRDCNN